MRHKGLLAAEHSNAVAPVSTTIEPAPALSPAAAVPVEVRNALGVDSVPPLLNDEVVATKL